MIIVAPKFRSPGASYFFVADPAGRIVAVCYPDGDRFLLAGEQD